MFQKRKNVKSNKMDPKNTDTFDQSRWLLFFWPNRTPVIISQDFCRVVSTVFTRTIRIDDRPHKKFAIQTKMPLTRLWPWVRITLTARFLLDRFSQCTIKPTTTTVHSHTKPRMQPLISRYVDGSDSPIGKYYWLQHQIGTSYPILIGPRRKRQLAHCKCNYRLKVI